MKSKKLGIILSVVGIILCSMGLLFYMFNKPEKKYFLPSSSVKKENNEEENVNKDENVKENENKEDTKDETSLDKEEIVDNSSDNVDKVTYFDYDKVEKNVLEEVQAHSYKYYLTTCKTEEDGKFQSTLKDVGADSFLKIIQKLKTSIRYESNITASFFCPAYSYQIGIKKDDHVEEKVFSLDYANNPKILIVGYQGVGYAFYFDSEVSGFLESL